MWRDVSLANRDALLAELEMYQEQLSSISALLRGRDGAGLQAVFEAARTARNDWEKSKSQ
jgi:prephenate dehydrogenase